MDNCFKFVSTLLNALCICYWFLIVYNGANQWYGCICICMYIITVPGGGGVGLPNECILCECYVKESYLWTCIPILRFASCGAEQLFTANCLVTLCQLCIQLLILPAFFSRPYPSPSRQHTEWHPNKPTGQTWSAMNDHVDRYRNN